MSKRQRRVITETDDECDGYELEFANTDISTDHGDDDRANGSNYSDSHFTGNSEDSEDHQIPMEGFGFGVRHSVRTKASLKDMSTGDTPMNSHRENQDIDLSLDSENLEMSQASVTKSQRKLKKGKGCKGKAKASQEPPVTSEMEQSTDENSQVTRKSSTATRKHERSKKKKSKEDMIAAITASKKLRDRRKNIENRELRDNGRDTTYVNTRDDLEDNRNRITSPSQAQDDDEIVQEVLTVRVRPKKRPYQRQKPSIVWKHSEKRKKDNDVEVVQCNYCKKNWNVAHLSGSTSNLLKHLRVQHYSKLTEQDRAELPQNGSSSGNRRQPRRTLNRREIDGQALPRSHKICQEMDRKIAKFFISSSCSWIALEDKNFANIFTDFHEGRYNIPCRAYLDANVIQPMYEETKLVIKEELSKHNNIAITTDAWTSMTQQSYITVTAHVIDEDKSELKVYVLSTAEITERHTSENLMEHIDKVLQEYNISKEYSVTCNFNAINLNDIHEEVMESDDEENHLNENSDLDEQLPSLERHQSQPTCSKTPDVIHVEKQQGKTKKILKHKKKVSDVAVDLNNDNERPNVTFVTDNASDIGKAIKKIGGFPWFGCAGHHLNLVAQEAFKKVDAASKLVRKCKRIVEFIKSSSPASYMLIKFQEELEMPILKLLQENNTRWWSILLMMVSIKENIVPLQLTISKCKNKHHLILDDDEQDAIGHIIDLFEPFKDAAEKLGAEKQVSISLIVPVIHYLKAHLEANVEDISMIRNMKIYMLEKLENRYSSEQMQVLKICTLLDVRFKNDEYVINDYDLLTDQVKKLDAEQKQHESQISQQESQVSQNEILATEGQEVNTGRTKKKRLIFEYDDDVVPQETGDQ